MATVDEIKKILNDATDAIDDLPEGELKIKAFEVILQHLLMNNISISTNLSTARRGTPKKPITRSMSKPRGEGVVNVDYAKIIEVIKTCDESEAIEQNIFSGNSQVDRTLLPIYIVHEYFDNEYGLTSGDIHKITTDLGIPISVANASRQLSGNASKYVIGNSLRKKGGVVRYKLHKRGVDYMKSVIAGAPHEVEE